MAGNPVAERDAMARARDLARRGPRGVNPQVGAVILSPDGRVLGEGWHRGAGTPHAEVDALSRLRPDEARGATAIVTLEPCNHTGRTGPCAEALVEAGVARVVFACADPGEVSSGGAARLRAAAVDVDRLDESEGEAVIADWLFVQRTGRPRVTVKWAQSLDGRAAAADGSSQWITGPAARAHVHRERSAHDAIAVGTGTVLADDPQLTARVDGDPDAPQPVPVVFGTRTIPSDAAVRRHPRGHRTAGHDLERELFAPRGRRRAEPLRRGRPDARERLHRRGPRRPLHHLPRADAPRRSAHRARRHRRRHDRRAAAPHGDAARAARPRPPGRGHDRGSALMFTGIIEELGEVVSLERNGQAWRLTVRGPLAVSDASHGDSIAVDGLCLTVVEQTTEAFTADVMQISVDMSTLGDRRTGDRVNLERAAAVGDRLGGHIVQGHIDGTARVLSIVEGDGQRTVRISLDPEHAHLVVRKGSIAVDGISLTTSAVSDPAEAQQWFEVSLIPETLASTTLGFRAVGDRVNIETDIVARHVERMLQREAS